VDTQPVSGLVTLAVLPFADLSHAKDQEYFSDGLTEEILNQLAQVKELAVTGRTSSFSFKGKNEDLRAIAQKLGVANLLEGSVRKNGNELRITAQLIDGSSGAHRWSQTYARELRDVFAVQEEIALDVARALSVTLDVGETSRARGGTTDIDAYDLYLQARKLFLEGGRRSSLRATELLREALRRDPQFVRAWSLMSQAASLASVTSPQPEADQLLREASEATERIRTLAPDSREAQSDRISQLMNERKWAEAVEMAATLMSRESLSADDLSWGSSILNVHFMTGRTTEAIRMMRGFMQREPLSMLASNDLQRMLYVAGQYDAAQAENERSKALPGDWSRPRGRALLLALRREPIDAPTVSALLAQTNRDEGLGLRSTTELARLGSDRKAMQDVLRRDFENAKNPTFTEVILFYQQADALGDRELALSALEKAIAATSQYAMLWLAPNSGVRSDPRFKALVLESGLVDYWRKSGNWGDFCKPVGSDDFECR
jgi:TolB-like protein